MRGSWRSLLAFQLVFSSLVLVTWTVWLGTSPLDEDYASGELLDHFLAWSETGTLYAPLADPPYRVLNYPPLVLWATRLAAGLGLPPLLAGRAVNTLSMLATLALVLAWLRKSGCSRLEALFNLGILGSSVAVLHLAGQFHLQWLAVFLSLAGLYRLNASAPASAGVLCALACFAKQTQVLTVLMALSWLAAYQRQRLAAFLAGVVSTMTVGWLGFTLAYGPEMWRHLVVYTVGTYSLLQLALRCAESVLPWSFLVAVAIWLGSRSVDARRELRWWFFCSTSLGLLSTARNGSSFQYFIEWSLATILWVGPSLRQLSARRGLTGLLIVQLIGADINELFQLTRLGDQLQSNRRLLAAVGPWLPPEPTMLCGNEPGLIRACGHLPLLQPFIMSNLARRGLWSDRPVVLRLEARQVPVVLLPFELEEDLSGCCRPNDRWTLAILQAIAQNYVTVATIDQWRVMKPIPSGSPAPPPGRGERSGAAGGPLPAGTTPGLTRPP